MRWSIRAAAASEVFARCVAGHGRRRCSASRRATPVRPASCRRRSRTPDDGRPGHLRSVRSTCQVTIGDQQHVGPSCAATPRSGSDSGCGFPSRFEDGCSASDHLGFRREYGVRSNRSSDNKPPRPLIGLNGWTQEVFDARPGQLVRELCDLHHAEPGNCSSTLRRRTMLSPAIPSPKRSTSAFTATRSRRPTSQGETITPAWNGGSRPSCASRIFRRRDRSASRPSARRASRSSHRAPGDQLGPSRRQARRCLNRWVGGGSFHLDQKALRLTIDNSDWIK